MFCDRCIKTKYEFINCTKGIVLIVYNPGKGMIILYEEKQNFCAENVNSRSLCGNRGGGVYAPSEIEVRAADNTELRGIWVSTVANIDYPSTQTTDSNVLKSQLTQVLDNCKDMGFNAVFFQVRPCGDAFYKSSIFPWSKYLTGTQGLAPDDDFDPLEFAVTEAHNRGMQLHAWINPYRITNNPADNQYLAKSNPAVLNPGLVMTDSDGKMYYNPGDSGSIDLIVRGAAEIAENYDVDGIHMDDYFYPSSDFNDDTTYSFHKDEYPNKADWRRANVDRLVETMNEKLHSIKPEIQFE